MNKQEWQSAFGEPSAFFHEGFFRTLDRLKEEKQVKKMSVRTALIALALTLALTCAAYAAVSQWMIGDYFGKRGPGSVPEGFESGYQGDYTQEIGDVRFHIRDAYVSGNVLTAMVEVSRTDGKPALFLTDSVEEEDLIVYYDQILTQDPEDHRTIAEYAKENGLPLYHAGSWFTQDGKTTESAGDEWAEDGFGRFVIFTQIQDIRSEGGKAKLSWDVYTADAEKGYQAQSMEIELPVEAYEEWTVEVDQAVEGTPVVIDRLMFRQSRMEMDVDIAYHLDMEKMPDTIAENTPAALDYRIIHLTDPDTDEKLPMGSRITGGMRWLNEAHTAFEGALDSIRGEYEKDTLRLKFFDPWQDAYYASIDVKIR